MAKKQAFDMEAFLRNNLQSRLQIELGKQLIEKTEMPEYFGTSLNPLMPLRPYQKEAFQYFINFMEQDFDGKPSRPQLLFHMATGSGKTLIMAGLILYLYQQGYRNFLFFVSLTNVVGKTEDNLFNSSSPKYLFSQSINIGGKQVEIRRVENFQGVDDDCINLCLTTTQKLHADLNNPKEGGFSYSDFGNKGLVMISDEAHHTNGAVKKGVDNALQKVIDFGNDDFTPSDDWESTVRRIFNRQPEDGRPNILLEFTATEDFTEPGIAEKYKDKVIFDYPLRRFRENGYSKDIAVVQSDSSRLDRAIQAMILSQYRRKLFTAIRQNVKPVVMFKSKTIKDNKEFHAEFVDAVKNLTVADLRRIRANASGDVLRAFTYIEEKGISYENLLLELRDDFEEKNTLLVDENNINPTKQAHLNSLEEADNEYRAVFAVDMLNEGWDVLNLYDIVRLYDTRDSNSNKPGKTTNAEAQLIGRGARYMPFSVESLPPGSRKFDNDLNNRLRVLETLHYHASHNPRYIQELNTALKNSGIIAEQGRLVTERLKESFKQTRLYTKGYVFANELVPVSNHDATTNICKKVFEKEYFVRIKSGEMEQSAAMSVSSSDGSSFLMTRKMAFGEIDKHVVRAAINRLPEFSFRSLSRVYPDLKSIVEFIDSNDYLAKVQVNVIGRKEMIVELSQKDKLYVALEVLKQIAPMLTKGGTGYKGTKIFKARQIKDVFRDHVFKVSEGGEDKESGQSIKTTTNPALRFDVDSAEWFAYDDNFGTSEEKFLIRYIGGRMDALREKYEEIFLLRNHNEVKIYSFDDDRATEPDFVLFMRRKGDGGKYDSLQIFIEPKGGHLRAADKWKEDFEKRIHREGMIQFDTAGQSFEIWGMPFYTESCSKEFNRVFNENFVI